jgi:colanic acid/amylovoran biosynthesis protein
VAEYGLTREQYLDELVAFSEQLLADKNTHLILIPHVFGSDTLKNDQAMIQRLAERLINLDRVSWADSSFNVCQFKYCIAQCHYFIGARTHSTLASLSSLVPTLSVAYSTKAYGINQDLFGHQDYVLPISELNRQTLMKKFCLLKERRSKIIEHLKDRVPEMKRLALQGGAFLVNLLRDHV